MSIPILEDAEFRTFQKIFFQEAGIDLSDKKKLLVQSRLLKQLLKYKFETYTEYLRLVQINQLEKVEMINLLTTNETYFFREMEHFEFLQKELIPTYQIQTKFRIWSAATSVGAEAYSAAMLLDTMLNKTKWEIIGTDINSEVIQKARIGLYPESWVEKIPAYLRKNYCLKGKGFNEGKFLIDRSLIPNMRFEEGNLLNIPSDFGKFDLIFLRNVLIYFNDVIRQKVVDGVVNHLLPGGYLFISHTENLNMIDTDRLEQIKTAIYRKRG